MAYLVHWVLIAHDTSSYQPHMSQICWTPAYRKYPDYATGQCFSPANSISTSHQPWRQNVQSAEFCDELNWLNCPDILARKQQSQTSPINTNSHGNQTRRQNIVTWFKVQWTSWDLPWVSLGSWCPSQCFSPQLAITLSHYFNQAQITLALNRLQGVFHGELMSVELSAHPDVINSLSIQTGKHTHTHTKHCTIVIIINSLSITLFFKYSCTLHWPQYIWTLNFICNFYD